MIQVKNLSKIIEPQLILDDISFSLDEKEILALVGPNGAGKTTLLKLLANLNKPNSGQIRILDTSYKQNPKHILKNLAFMQDATTLYDDLTGSDHLEFVGKLHSSTQTEIDKLIIDLKMDNYIHMKVKKYSLGMKQSLLFALCVVKKPKIILMDEPLNGLDPSVNNIFRRRIIDMKQQGTSFLFSSHILSEIDKIADRILFLKDGKFIDQKVIQKNKSKKNVYLLKVDSDFEIVSKLLTRIGLTPSYIKEKNSIELKTSCINNALKLLVKNNIFIRDIIKESFTSEHIYHDLYGEDHHQTLN